VSRGNGWHEAATGYLLQTVVRNSRLITHGGIRHITKAMDVVA